MKSPRIMFLYAAFLLVCSLLAFVLADDKSKAGTALYMGGGSAIVIALCGFMAGQIHTRRVIGMIGIHAGLILPALFAIEFTRRGYGNFTKTDGKTYLAVIFTVMAVGSVIAFLAILKTRPPMNKRA